MGIFSVLLTVLGAVIAGLFFRSDCDKIFLRYLPYDEKKAFEGAVIWITGASTGIGASLAFDLCKGGAQIVISARQVTKLEAVARRCVEHGALAPMIVPLDVLQTEEHAVAYKKIVEKFGRLDSLVLNPGRSQRQLAVDTTLEDTKGLVHSSDICSWSKQCS